jgi:butyryl-CoA dehydrogenase
MLYNVTRLSQQPDADPTALTRAAAMTKYLASEAAERTASLAVETVGGRGFCTGEPVEKLYRDAKVGKIYEGTSNMQFRIIAAGLTLGSER